MHFKFSTKAKTLEALASQKTSFAIPPLYYFTVREWQAKASSILQKIQALFPKTLLAIRSSTLTEDSVDVSMAGAFHSCLAVKSWDRDALQQAIQNVINSYSENSNDQVLIQTLITDIVVSGVIMTRCLQSGAPYYVLNYDDESGKTDSITGGTGVSKSVFIHRACEEKYIESERVKKMLRLARELEAICGNIPLDIEFGIHKTGSVYLFQVRRICTTGKWHPDIEKRVCRKMPFIETFIKERSTPKTDIWGERTILGNMPDWNPAEIIGTTPRPLAISLYREIVTKSIWQQARVAMGYRQMPPQELMVLIAGQPYIDVRNSFNSFLPAGLESQVGWKLVNAWLDRLDTHPEFHDKIEFEVAQTIVDFSFEDHFAARYSECLSTTEFDHFKNRLLYLTNQCLNKTSNGSLATSLSTIETLNHEQKTRQWQESETPLQIIAQIDYLLDECKRLGTLPFSIIARHGFIAETLLRSAITKGAIAPDRVQIFKQSFRTILGKMTVDMQAVYREQLATDIFMERYGHLRPGTYDILSLCYKDREDLFDGFIDLSNNEKTELPYFELSKQEEQQINQLLHENKILAVDAQGLLAYARQAIVGREYAKFIFTKNLSEVLEKLAQWGTFFNLGRDDLSYLSLPAILNTAIYPFLDDAEYQFAEQVEKGQQFVSLSNAVKLSYLIRGIKDIYIVPLHRAAPNFITSQKIEGTVILLKSDSTSASPLYGKIVCIENADPGFDWIFTKGIKGLITQYGGTNSHMAIRCAELGLPAAIGCGEQTFAQIIKTGLVELNCRDKMLRASHGTIH